MMRLHEFMLEVAKRGLSVSFTHTPGNTLTVTLRRKSHGRIYSCDHRWAIEHLGFYRHPEGIVGHVVREMLEQFDATPPPDPGAGEKGEGT